MIGYINRTGQLTLQPETTTEEYALMQWFGEACDGTVSMSVKMTGLELGPQPVELKSMPRENDDGDEEGK